MTEQILEDELTGAVIVRDVLVNEESKGLVQTRHFVLISFSARQWYCLHSFRKQGMGAGAVL